MTDVTSQVARDDRQRGAVIFESYGWIDAPEIARKIKASLEQHGFEVWLDSDHISPDELDFWTPLQDALERCRLVVALLSPHSVRLDDDIDAARRMSVCHNELIQAVRMQKAVIPVVVVKCEPPLAINHYDPIDLTNWHMSPSAYDDGISEVIHWIREGLADRRRYCIYVDNLSQDRMSFPEEQTAALGFVGRDWIVDRFSAWLESRLNCFLVEAEPGSGKTALVAELLRRNPDGHILAYHFCNAQREETLDPRRFIRSLAAMIGGTVPEYRARLRGSEDLIRALRDDGDPATMLRQAILEPLGRIDPGGVRCIVVDALDEATDTRREWSSSIPRLLAGAVRSFPPWLKLMVTTRPHDRVLPLFQDAEHCVLGGDVAAQQDDVRRFIDRRLAVPVAGGAERGQLIDALAERSDGNFQYAEMVLDELDAGSLAAGDIDGLPRSLAGLYYNRADALFPDGEGFADARLVLGVLLAAREPLSRSQLAAITGLGRDDALLPLLRSISHFAVWDPDVGDEGVYRIAHKSISDWLLAPARGFDRFKVDLSVARDRLLAHCRGWEGHLEPYALRHLVAHLLDAGLRDDALALVRGSFFETRRKHLDSGDDLGDARNLTLALVEHRDAVAILELARTDNIRQRDGVAAALLACAPEADEFVHGVVVALLKMR
ncbi:MAG: TIR domain-containing protein [Alphaproteobacteria bacterium]